MCGSESYGDCDLFMVLVQSAVSEGFLNVAVCNLASADWGIGASKHVIVGVLGDYGER